MNSGGVDEKTWQTAEKWRHSGAEWESRNAVNRINRDKFR
jgi:hypothetical protein